MNSETGRVEAASLPERLANLKDRAERHPGVVEILEAYGKYGEVVGRTSEYLAWDTPVAFFDSDKTG